MSATHYAGQCGKIEILKILISKNFDLNVKQPSSGKTILHFAVEYDNTSLSRFLIGQKDVDVTVSAYFKIVLSDRTVYCAGNTALHIAVIRENLELVQFVSNDRRGKSLMAVRNQMSVTPLELALLLKDEEISKFLLTKVTKSVIETYNKNGDPLFHWALKTIDYNFLDQIDFLNYVVSPSSLKLLNRFGQSVMSYLIRLDRLDEIQFLLRSAKSQIISVDLPNLADRDGTTALMFAVMKGNKKMVNYLVNQGAGTANLASAPFRRTNS